MLRGIDVSQHQGNIDWNAVKNEVDFVILRLGWIGNKNNHTLDTRFEQYYNNCKQLGIPVGVYVYNYCISETAVQSGASWTVSKLQGKKLELPVYIDMEDSSGTRLGKDLNTKMCVAFNSIIESAGRSAGVYANLNWFNNYLHKDVIKKKYQTWIAHYGVSEEKYKGQYNMLQYTSKGRVSGILGNVDMNVLYDNIIKKEENKKPENNQTKGGYDMKSYKNGSKAETVFQDSNCTKIIGSLNPYEACDCLGEFTNGKNERVAVVMYTIDGSKPADRKVGFVKYIGGIGK